MERLDKKTAAKTGLALIVCLLTLSSIPPNVLGTEISIVATADSYTSSINPNDNYGGSEYLFCYYYTEDMYGTLYSQEDHTWLKFDLSEIPTEATVNSIILRMHTWTISPGATNKVGVFLGSSSNWQELTIKWSNCPVAIGQPIDTAYITTHDRDYDFDVTTAVKRKSVVTLVLKTLEPTGLSKFAAFNSREISDANHRPKLVVEYTTPSQSVPVDPFVGLMIGGLAVIVVVLVAYAVIKRKKKLTSVLNSNQFFWFCYNLSTLLTF